MSLMKRAIVGGLASTAVSLALVSQATGAVAQDTTQSSTVSLSSPSYLQSIVSSIFPSQNIARGTAPSQPESISQGSRIYVDDGDGNPNTFTACTIGSVDPATHTATTASHCIEESNQVYAVDGETIIGYGTPSADRDWATIQLEPTITIGSNNLSNQAFDPDGVQPGDGACMYGSTTKAVICGTVNGTDGSKILFDDIIGKPGDSGGPVWTDQGFVGQYNGVMIRESPDSKIVKGLGSLAP